jgi:hypothetical protein
MATKRKYRPVSTSFNKVELNLLARILTLITRGGDASVLARHPEFTKIYNKTISMARRHKALKEKKDDGD